MAEARPICAGLFVETDAGPRLLAGRCAGCRRLHFPATATCPYCGGDGCANDAVGPHGTLFLYTTVATRPPGYRGAVPFGFGVVELPEGLRVVTRLTETDLRNLAPGMPMRLVVTPVHDEEDGTGVVSYAFAPEGDTRGGAP